MNKRPTRPYDAGIPPALLDRVRARRLSPDGRQLSVRTVFRQGLERQEYPWQKLQPGDYFLAKFTLSNRKSLPVSCRQSAARNDMEVSLDRIEIGGEGYLRVTCVLLDVSNVRRRAEGLGYFLPEYSDGKWRSTRKTRENERKSSQGRRRRLGHHSDPFWADKSSDEKQDAPSAPLEDKESISNRRAAIIAAALAAEGEQ